MLACLSIPTAPIRKTIAVTVLVNRDNHGVLCQRHVSPFPPVVLPTTIVENASPSKQVSPGAATLRLVSLFPSSVRFPTMDVEIVSARLDSRGANLKSAVLLFPPAVLLTTNVEVV